MDHKRNPRVIVSVTNDLVTDQRVHRSCISLHEAGYEVLLVGRRLRGSPVMPERPYRCCRMRLLFRRGPLFYAEFNLRLFFFLFIRKVGILLANDLDTLLANTLAARLKGCRLVFDSHEYFTGVPEVMNRPRVKAIWERIERYGIPRTHARFTVNNSIADLFEKEYGMSFSVIRNLPMRQEQIKEADTSALPHGRFILMQGNGINVDRGGEEAVLAMHHISHTQLVILGAGDVIPKLKEMVVVEGLQDKVVFIGRQTPDSLPSFTRKAFLGLSLDKPAGINQRLSLPNKLFDYIQAGVPVVATTLPEVSAIIQQYQVGVLIDELSPESLAETVKRLTTDEEQYAVFKENCQKAAVELNWDSEKPKLIATFDALTK